jgi:hypothetical protein
VPGGTRIVFLRWAPESSAPEDLGDPDALAAEASEKLPGLLDVFEPDAPGMHTTDHLELDDGEEVTLTPGACVVQRGTRHAWFSGSVHRVAPRHRRSLARHPLHVARAHRPRGSVDLLDCLSLPRTSSHFSLPASSTPWVLLLAAR